MNGKGIGSWRFGMRETCPICGARSVKFGAKHGRYIDHTFTFRECLDCTYIFVEDPSIDFDRIYDEAYYRAEGADPLTNYMFELQNPAVSIRTQELIGISEAVSSIIGSVEGKSWMDFGCGNGGLVRHLRKQTAPDAASIVGFEDGWIADEARRHHINVVTGEQADAMEGRFDVVTAIEVLEHVLDPVATLGRIHKLLKPGGLFFYTTSNAAKHRRGFLEWGYTIPEIHIGYFNPRSISIALGKAGFSVRPAQWLPGFEKIIRFKTLKTLAFKADAPLFNLVPWSIVARLIDLNFRISDMPLAFAKLV